MCNYSVTSALKRINRPPREFLYLQPFVLERLLFISSDNRCDEHSRGLCQLIQTLIKYIELYVSDIRAFTVRFRGTGVSQGALFIKNPVLGTYEDRSCRH